MTRRTVPRYPAPQGEGGFDACWYPVAISAEVTAGELRASEFLDGSVLVYRGRSGAVHVVSPYCRHLGADLGVGAVVGDELQCAFHHWRYRGDGACSAVPVSGGVPDIALHAYPVAESMGLIWAFNGEAQSYPVPCFERPEVELEMRAYEAPNVLPVDPIVQLLNAFDLQHFQAVHGLDLQADAYEFDGPLVDCTFSFTAPELGAVKQRRRVWGTSCITMNGVGAQPSSAAGLVPLPGRRTRMFVVHAAPKGEGAHAALDAAQAYALRLIGEDWPILRSIRFRPDVLVRSDALLARALRWAAAFPRAHPSGERIRLAAP